MDTFTIEPRRNWLIRVLGRNPLVRRSDRIEAWSVMAAALVLTVATPFVCAFGTSLQDSRSRAYAEEALHRHMVTATAIEPGELIIEPNYISYNVQAQWNAAGGRHAGIVKWSDRAKIGDHEGIWVDDEGQYAQPPRSPGRATTDAWAIAVSAWLAVFIVVAGSLHAIRSWLDARRFAQWDLELSKIAEDGNRKNSQ
jgi:hypothetical protein